MPDTSTTIFFAGLAAALVAARYFLGSSQDTASGQTSRGPREITEDMVSVVSVLVPDVDRSTIRASLEETRSIQRTTETLLSRSKQQPAKAKTSSSLLDKYDVPTTTSAAPSESDSTWIDDRAKREERFRQQRQQMILKARQRTLELEEKQKQQNV